VSAFSLIYDAAQRPIDRSVFDSMMDRLSHRGPDGKKIVEFDRLLLGHWHFWTTPEEVNERQPLALPKLPYRIALDGRLDNREEIIALLELDPAKAARFSDAALILQAYNRWQEKAFLKIVGVFALAIYDEEKKVLLCARDHLGDRTLFYTETAAGRVVVASEPWAVAATCDLQPGIDPGTVAHFFNFSTPQDGATFYEGIYELLPAHLMRISAKGVELVRYWQPDPDKKIRYKTEAEYVQHFLSLLEESIRARMRSPSPIAVAMSGGLDSTAIASLAAKEAAPQKLTAISVLFDELNSCDERQYINPVIQHCDLKPVHLYGDADWTFKNSNKSYTQTPNHPEFGPFPLLLERIYQGARTAGARVLLTGEGGDLLYLSGVEWMLDYIVERRFRAFLSALKRQLKAKGFRYFFRTSHFRPLFRSFFERFFPRLARLRREKLKRKFQPWLSDYAETQLSAKIDIPDFVSPSLKKHTTLLGLKYAHICSEENAFASHHQVELRFPYRDRRLVEYSLSVPGYLMYAKWTL
jgi:asparagine synthase (glutamine-hydrolysing)